MNLKHSICCLDDLNIPSIKQKILDYSDDEGDLPAGIQMTHQAYLFLFPPHELPLKEIEGIPISVVSDSGNPLFNFK